MIKVLNQILIHVDSVEQFKNMYCENNSSGTEYKKYTNPRLNQGTVVSTVPDTNGTTTLVIPYGSLVHIKDAQLHWTHGQIYIDTDNQSVSSNSATITAENASYTLEKDSNGNLRIKKVVPVTITGYIDDGTVTGSGSSQQYSDYSNSHTVTITPSNSIHYTVDPGTHSVEITKIVFSKSSTYETGSTTTQTLSDNNVVTGSPVDKTASVASNGNGFVAASTSTGTVTASNRTVTAAAPATQYVKIGYKVDGGGEQWHELNPKSYTSASYTITVKYDIVYRTTQSGQYSVIKTVTSAPTSFDKTITSGQWFYFGFPSSWGSLDQVKYGPNTETTMFAQDANMTYKGITYKVYKRLAAADAASTLYTITIKNP